MKKAAKQEPAQRKKPAREEAAPAEGRRPAFLPPLRPRPRLFYALLVVLGIWVAFLLTLYFTTVYPEREKQLIPVQEDAAREP